MKLKINYLHPKSDEVTHTGLDYDGPHVVTWLEVMLELFPESIWFFTTDSTDIFED